MATNNAINSRELIKTNNLSDLANAGTARTNLGLGTAAVVATDLADLNEATIESAIDTLANLTSIQGRTVTLADAGANAVFGWDDTAGAYENLTAGEVRGAIGLATTDSPMFTGIELGHATDTTLSRVSAGLVAIEGNNIARSTDVQVFTSTGANTWTKPANAKYVEVILIAGGGGGGSGRKGAALSDRIGGCGGAGGGYSRIYIAASLLGSSETVTVGAGGTGGVAQSTNSTDGNAGTNGANTTFGSILYSGGGMGGAGGDSVGAILESSGGLSTAFPSIQVSGWGQAQGYGGIGGYGGNGGNGNYESGTNSTASCWVGGGAGGGGIDTGNAVYNGGTGGAGSYLKDATGFAGGAAGSGAAGGNGTAATANSPYGGGGGGGGGARHVGGNAYAGGNGALYGAGGGGGGASTNSVGDSGAGGNGANGIAIITTYF